MQKVCDFLKKANTYYLATEDGGQPHVRPFGTAHIFRGKLYFQTGRVKNVYRHLKANPKVELCAMLGDAWLRVEATAVEDNRTEAVESMLDDYVSLKSRYKAGDGNATVFYLKDAVATFYSFSAEPEVVKF